MQEKKEIKREGKMNARKERIAALKKEISELEGKEKELNSLPEDQRLATIMHEAFCRANHIDGCGWYYEKDWNDKHWTKPRYLEAARKVLNVITFEQAETIIGFMKGL